MTTGLHLAFGLGEDWNKRDRGQLVAVVGLHLAFGLGEDWNLRQTVAIKFSVCCT